MDEDKVPEPLENVTLRDRISIAAMAAMLRLDETAMYTRRNMEELAVDSYTMADLMLKARESSSTESATRT